MMTFPDTSGDLGPVEAPEQPRSSSSSLVLMVSISRWYPAEKLGLPPTERRWPGYNGSFSPEQHTPSSWLSEIMKGYASCAVLGKCEGMCCGTWCTNPQHLKVRGHCGRPHGYRRNAHFQSAQFVPTDSDTQDERSSIRYLTQQPLIAQRAAFIHTTLSHTPGAPKCRAMFITDSPFTDPVHYRRAKLAVMAQLPWSDGSVHDPSRLFYGSDPDRGEGHYIGNILSLEVVEHLIEQRRAILEAAESERSVPEVPTSRVMGSTPAERYVSAAIESEREWLAAQVEGTGQRHRGLLLAALKLGSLKLSEWLPSQVRAGIDPYGVLLPAAALNGYISKYGELTARRTIADGVAYASPRRQPQSWDRPRTRAWLDGGYPVAGVQL